jgi:UDP-3-O-[3-hydroxymyristoyl] glucosamine N-acyltransferase
MKAFEIAALVNGKVDGNPDIEVFKPSKIEEGEPGSISFLANLKYEDFIYNCKSSVILVSKDFVAKQKINSTLIRVENVYSALTVLLEHFGDTLSNKENNDDAEISDRAFVHPESSVSEGVKIGAFSYVGNKSIIRQGTVIHPQVFIDCSVSIGKNCILYPGVKIFSGTIIGDNCILHANAVIGSDGFGFAPQADGTFKKIPQLGLVELCDFVEIGANTVIDRATMGKTLIEKGVKLDNLIQIAHNVTVGENTVIAAQAGIAGSTKIGNNCMIGGQVGIVGHISIANGTKIQAQSGINKTVKTENTALFGSPALLYNDFLRANAVFKQLPELLKRVDDLEKQLKNNNSNLKDK